VRLQQLEEMLGGDEFCQLLATVAGKRIRTAQVFLDELQAEVRLKSDLDSSSC